MDRDTLKSGVGNFGSTEYAREELRAEMSAMMTGERVGVGHDGSRGAAYVEGWLKALEDDPKEIYKAAADAPRRLLQPRLPVHRGPALDVADRLDQSGDTGSNVKRTTPVSIAPPALAAVQVSS